jgi:hypothetical protein
MRRVSIAILMLSAVTVGACVTRTAQDPPAEAPAAAAAPDTLALPELSAALSPEAISTLLGEHATPHRFAQDEPQHREGWEWSEPAGRYMQAEYRDGRLVDAYVRRPYAGRLPEVPASALWMVRDSMSEGQLDSTIGHGWAIERTIWDGGGGAMPAEVRGWAIYDKGHDTGATLKVRIAHGVVISVAHPWRKS